MASGPYDAVEPPAIRTAFWDFYKVFWEIESEFDLLFRLDAMVPLWQANRVRLYYECASQLGLYSQQTALPQTQQPSATRPGLHLDPCDLYVQTGATGPATANRTRSCGCVYTSGFVEEALAEGLSVLLVHDDPDRLEHRAGLQAITSQELRHLARAAAPGAKADTPTFDPQAMAFWDEVGEAFQERLGPQVISGERAQFLARSYWQQYRHHRGLFLQMAPNAMVCMAHYFRTPQIDAARRLKIRVADYQHGINSRFHLGYGYPNVQPDERRIPAFPDEFWAWGRFWAPGSWFPHTVCDVRRSEHQQLAAPQSTVSADEPQASPDVMVVTSWAMRVELAAFVKAAALANPEHTFWLKLHPRETANDYRALTDAVSNVRLIAGEADVVEAARGLRYVVGICSSALFDVVQVGCRIAVIRLPAVEYAEEFVTRFGVPVIEADGSGLPAAIEAMDRMTLPTAEIFHRMHPVERTLRLEALSVPRALLWNPLPDNDARRTKWEMRIWKRRGNAFSTPADIETLVTGRGGPRQRLLAPFARRFLRRDYARALRQWQSREDNASPRSAYRPLLNALKAGISPAHAPALLRGFLSDPGRRSDRVLEAVASARDAASLPLRAEILEHRLRRGLVDPMPARGWETACTVLEELAPVTSRFARRYRHMARQASAEFADTRIDVRETQALRDLLVSALRETDELSLMRVGDGEVYAFSPPYLAADVLEADRAHRETIWWGRTLDEDRRQTLRDGLVEAFCAATHLGPPSPFRLLRDLPRSLSQMRRPFELWSRTSRAHRILFEELERLEREDRLDWRGKVLVDERCNQDLFHPRDLASLTVDGRPNVLVSCFSHQDVNRALGFAHFVDSIGIPPHRKVRHALGEGPFGDAILPEVLDGVMDEVERKSQGGAVLYVAGGIVGKLLIHQAQRSGAAALDIGAAADYWMGLSTRGPLDFSAYS